MQKIAKSEKQGKIFLLFGMTTAGKTTIGRAIAGMLKGQFVDIDVKIAEKVNMGVRSFYAKYGKAVFRQVECEVFREVLKQGEKASEEGDSLVISVGGGLMENEGAIRLLQVEHSYIAKRGGIFFLDMPAKILWGRVLRKAKQDKTFPAFLCLQNSTALYGEPSLFDKSFAVKNKAGALMAYRARFLAIYKKRMAFFVKEMQKIDVIKIKCKGKRVRELARNVIKSSIE